MDEIFLLTLLFIFATTFASTYLARMVRDRCLKDFEAYDVTFEMTHNRRFWGQLRTYSNGVEIIYEEIHHSSRGHEETSAIFQKSRMPEILRIYRFHDELTPAKQRRREGEVEIAYRPALDQQLIRSLRNFVNTFRDAINESIGFVVSRAKQTTRSAVLQTQDTRIAQIGQTVLDTTTDRQAFEPILERYIGRRVVVEERTGDQKWQEHAGILKDYTADWIELLDCRFYKEYAFDLSNQIRLGQNQNLDFIIRKGPEPGQLRLAIENFGSYEITVVRLEGEGFYRTLNQTIPPGAAAVFPLGDLPRSMLADLDLEALPDEIGLRAEGRAQDGSAAQPRFKLPPITVLIRTVRVGDLMLPRSSSYVKHGSELVETGWLRESGQELLDWARVHRRRSGLQLLWIGFNGTLGLLVSWSFLRWFFTYPPLLWALSGVGAAGVMLVWLTEWSALIRGKERFARKQSRRLRLGSLIMCLYLALVLLL